VLVKGGNIEEGNRDFQTMSVVDRSCITLKECRFHIGKSFFFIFGSDERGHSETVLTFIYFIVHIFGSWSYLAQNTMFHYILHARNSIYLAHCVWRFIILIHLEAFVFHFVLK
jgi:hypothetical protein